MKRVSVPETKQYASSEECEQVKQQMMLISYPYGVTYDGINSHTLPNQEKNSVKRIHYLAIVSTYEKYCKIEGKTPLERAQWSHSIV